MFQAFIKPKPGLMILDPGDANRVLPEEGKLVREYESYWTRQLESGDVTKITSESEEKKVSK